ncbi:MAG: hypothetical protein IJL94_00430 [Erysipelotrichaceae bacterium]|nr:hypothetical protein [Erysipelotrichaceae bacterium]
MKIEILFPEVCNQYGDFSNVIYLRQSFKDAEFHYCALHEEPYFVKNDVDMIYIGSLAEKYQKMVAEQLRPHKMRLWKLIENNTVVLVTGNAADLFGRYIMQNGEKVEGIGLFDYHVIQDKEHRNNSQFVGRFEDIMITGLKSNFSNPAGNFGTPLFEIVRGHGNNGKDEEEGIRYNNCFITYLLGPLLPQNPLFLKRIMEILHYDGKPAFEKEAMEAYERRLAQMSAPGVHTDLNYHGV